MEDRPPRYRVSSCAVSASLLSIPLITIILLSEIVVEKESSQIPNVCEYFKIGTTTTRNDCNCSVQSPPLT